MTLKSKLTKLANRLPYIEELYQEVTFYRKNLAHPPGHYYSPLVSIDEIEHRENEIWSETEIDSIRGIELNTGGQLKLVKEFYGFYKDLPFSSTPQGTIRYYYENDFYSYTDGIILYSIMRYYKPSRIIEIGSGFSSALMLDTNELFFNNTIDMVFVEPHPERLYSLIGKKDIESTTILEKGVQFVDLNEFDKLNAGDILFVDSTHVVKTGSDVNYIIFEILPRLKSGVLVHFHDIFYPFEYPKEWVLKGLNWNEDYLLKGFLMYNEKFEIKVFSQYIHKHHKETFAGMPLCYKNHGGNLWLEKK